MTTIDKETMADLGGDDGMTTMTAAAQSRVSRHVPLGAVWRAGLLAALIAGAGNFLIYALARTLGVSFLMPLQPGAEPTVLPPELVVVMSVAGAVAGTVAFALLDRLAPGHPRLFRNVALVFLLLSFAGPLSLPSTEATTKGTLMLMHVVAGALTISLLSGPGRR